VEDTVQTKHKWHCGSICSNPSSKPMVYTIFFRSAVIYQNWNESYVI